MAFGQWDPQLGLWTDPASKSVFAKGMGGWVDPEGKWWKGGQPVDPAQLDHGTLSLIGQFAQAAQKKFAQGASPLQPPKINASPAPVPKPAPAAQAPATGAQAPQIHVNVGGGPPGGGFAQFAQKLQGGY